MSANGTMQTLSVKLPFGRSARTHRRTTEEESTTVVMKSQVAQISRPSAQPATEAYLLTRIETLEKAFGPGKGRVHLGPEEIREGLASFYYDLTAATSPAQLFALHQMVPTTQLLMGFDNPFMPAWTLPPAIQDIQRWNGFSDKDVSSLARRNAEWLYPALAVRMQRSKAA
jgi:hypothetical protein